VWYSVSLILVENPRFRSIEIVQRWDITPYVLETLLDSFLANRVWTSHKPWKTNFLSFSNTNCTFLVRRDSRSAVSTNHAYCHFEGIYCIVAVFVKLN
jgi:hypothetical protein